MCFISCISLERISSTERIVHCPNPFIKDEKEKKECIDYMVSAAFHVCCQFSTRIPSAFLRVSSRFPFVSFLPSDTRLSIISCCSRFTFQTLKATLTIFPRPPWLSRTSTFTGITFGAPAAWKTLESGCTG